MSDVIKTRKRAIAISFILALVFTTLITIGANSKNIAENKKVEVMVAKRTLPFGTSVTPADYEKVQVPESMSKNMVADPDFFTGKTLILPVGQGHYIYQDSFREGLARRPGYSEVFIEVDLHKSALALPGEYVDLVPIDTRNDVARPEPIARSVRVLHAVDSKGWDIDPLMKNGVAQGLKNEDKKYPVTVGIEISPDLVTAVVPYADKKIQLVKGDAS